MPKAAAAALARPPPREMPQRRGRASKTQTAAGAFFSEPPSWRERAGRHGGCVWGCDPAYAGLARQRRSPGAHVGGGSAGDADVWHTVAGVREEERPPRHGRCRRRAPAARGSLVVVVGGGRTHLLHAAARHAQARARARCMFQYVQARARGPLTGLMNSLPARRAQESSPPPLARTQPRLSLSSPHARSGGNAWTTRGARGASSRPTADDAPSLNISPRAAAGSSLSWVRARRCACVAAAAGWSRRWWWSSRCVCWARQPCPRGGRRRAQPGARPAARCRPREPAASSGARCAREGANGAERGARWPRVGPTEAPSVRAACSVAPGGEEGRGAVCTRCGMCALGPSWPSLAAATAPPGPRVASIAYARAVCIVRARRKRLKARSMRGRGRLGEKRRSGGGCWRRWGARSPHPPWLRVCACRQSGGPYLPHSRTRLRLLITFTSQRG